MAKKKTPARKAAKKTPAKKARKAAPKASRKAPAKKATGRKTPGKKRSTKKAPAKKTGASSRTQSGRKKSTAKKRSTKKAAPKTAFEKRDANARKKGYESYWDERRSRERARQALAEIGHPNPDAVDATTLADVDELGTLGRGESARELYYKTKTILEKYEPSPSDSQIWSLIRIFYKPRGGRR